MARVKEIQVNGKRWTIDADAETPLLTVLREQLDLTGTKYGCGEGQCGACTVLVGGFPRHSCRTPVGTVGNKPVTTVEGLAQNGKLHPVQQAFVEEGAFQCAYCTSGMMMTGAALLASDANPSEEKIRTFLNGNICRCGTYPRIVAAIRRAAELMRKSG